MDRFAKAVLVVIALALVAIAVKMWEPKEAQAAPLLASGPTWGDWLEVKDASPEEKAKFFNRVPLVRVWGEVSIRK